MARVQCFDCDMPVVVDPGGRCPEGHDLGPVGERIEQSLGREEPHPDEPQPWVAVLDADEVEPGPQTPTQPRTARPISIGPDPTDAELNSSSTDGLLQELTALHRWGDIHADERPDGVSIARSSTNGETPTAPGDHDPSATAATAATPETDGPTSDAPTSPEAADAWDDWDDWNDRSSEGTPDTPAAPPAATVGDTSPEDDESCSAAIPQDAVPDIEPTPTPRRAPTVRSEESLSAMAELAALLGDDGPTPTPPSPPAPTPAPTSTSRLTPPGPASADPRFADPTSPDLAATEPVPIDSPSPQPGPTSPSSPAPHLPPVAAETTPDQTDSSAPPGDRLATVSQLPVRPRSYGNDQTPPPPPSTQDDEAPSPESGKAASGETIDWANFTARGKRRRFGR